MKRRISIIALLLAVLMVASVFVACQDGNPDESKGGTVSKSEGDGRYVADLPEFTWDTKTGTYGTFDVLVTSQEGDSTYFSEEIGYDLYETTDEVLNAAVMERNNYVDIFVINRIPKTFQFRNLSTGSKFNRYIFGPNNRNDGIFPNRIQNITIGLHNIIGNGFYI